MTTTPYHPPGRNGAVVAAAAAVALVATVGLLVGVLAVTGSLDSNATPLVVTLVGMVVSVVPALVGAIFSERASRDIRNGTVVEKAREGAALALEDAPLAEHAKQGAAEAIREEQVMRRDGPVVTAEVAALAELVAVNREIRDAITAPPDGAPT